MLEGRLGLAAGVALAAAACAGGNSRQTDLAYIERPVETIYNEALRSLDRNIWALAAARSSTKSSASTRIRPGPSARC